MTGCGALSILGSNLVGSAPDVTCRSALLPLSASSIGGFPWFEEECVGKIVVGRSVCTGLGICESLAPDVFEVNDGYLELKTDGIPDGQLEDVEAVVVGRRSGIRG